LYVILIPQKPLIKAGPNRLLIIHVPTPTTQSSTETNCPLKLPINIGNRVVVEGKFLPVLHIPDGIHAENVLALRNDHLHLAVGVA